MAIRKKETAITVTPLFEETKKVLESIFEKEREIQAGYSEQVYDIQKEQILEALEEVETATEQVKLEIQLKQIEIDRKKDLKRAYFAAELSEEEIKKARKNYLVELQEANKRLEIAKAKYQEVKFDIYPSITALKEILNVYKNLEYAREIEYRLDKQKDTERKRYLDVNKHSPYTGKISYIKALIQEANKYFKKQEYFEKRLKNS